MGRRLARMDTLSLRLRIVLLVLLAALPPLFVLFQRSRLEREMVGREVAAEAVRMARVAALGEERVIAEARALLETVRAVVTIYGPAETCERILPALIAGDPRLANLGVIGPDGYVICAARMPAGPPAFLGDRDYFAEARDQRRFSIGRYQVGKLTGEATVNFGLPILQGERFAGVVYAAVRLGWLQPLVDRAELPEGSTVFVVDEAGSLLTRIPPGDLQPGTPILESGLFDEMRAKGEGTIVARGLDGENRMYGYTFVPRGEGTLGVFVGVGIPVAAALEPIEQIGRRDMWALVAVALVSMLAAWIGGTLLLRPIRALVLATQRLQRGQLATRSGARGPGELRELATSFDAMAASLEQTTGRLRERADEMAALATAARALVEDLGLERVANVVVEQAAGVLHGERAALWIVEGKELVLVASRGYGEEALEKIRRLSLSSETAATAAANSGTPVRIDVASDAERWPNAAEVARIEGLQSGLNVPLTWKGSVVAVLAVASSAPHRFGEEETHLAVALGDLFAAAVQNARLFQQVRENLWLRDSFIAAAAHELRTPATSLKGYAQLLQRLPPRNEREQRLVERIAQVTERTARLARELVEAQALIARPEVTREPVELLPVLQRAAAEAIRLQPGKKVEVSGSQVTILGDAERLVTAIAGLLDVALRYQPEGATVEVEATATDGQARIRIRDHGPGIPPDRLPHVFEPLFEPWPPGSAHYTGVVGLGPFLARAMARAHGGTVEVESTLGEGTTFTFCLPRQD